MTPNSTPTKRSKAGKLGKHQIDLLSGMAGVGRALVVPDNLTRSLCERGLMEPSGPEGGMIVVTPAGLRTVADLIDAGLVIHKPDWKAKVAARKARV